MIKDFRFLVKNIFTGIKAAIIGLQKIPGEVRPEDEFKLTNRPFAFNHQLSLLYRDVLRYGIHAFDFFVIDGFNDDGVFDKSSDKNFYITRDSKICLEEKETIEAFSTIFIQIDPFMFQDAVSPELDFIVSSVIHNNSLASVTQHLLSSLALSQNFPGLLMNYLVRNYERLGDHDTYGNTIFKLFKLLFVTIAYYPDKIESILKPHLTTIIMNSFKFAPKSEDSSNYFQVLRALFRAISGGRYESLYQEVVPLLQIILENLNQLLGMANNVQTKELFAELCLTVPVRLSVLLPYLSFLLQPLLTSLQAGPELASQGLRTLELCLDNLTEGFLEPILTPLSGNIMKGLYRHLQVDMNEGNAQTALRILGKLGGKNRRDIHNLSFAHVDSKAPRLNLEYVFDLDSNQIHTLPLNDALVYVSKIIKKEYPIEEKELFRVAYDFNQNCISKVLGITYLSAEEYIAVKVGCDKFLQIQNSSMDTEQDDPNDLFEAIGPFPRISSEQEGLLLTELFENLMCSTMIDQLKEDANCALDELVKVFAAVAVLDTVNKMGSSEYQSNACPFIQAIVNLFKSSNPELRKVAENAIVAFKLRIDQLLLSEETVQKMLVWDTLSSQLVLSCYLKNIHSKMGACSGISTVVFKLNFGKKWIISKEIEFLKALLYVLKDSNDLICSNDGETRRILSEIMRQCHHDQFVGEEYANVLQLFITV